MKLSYLYKMEYKYFVLLLSFLFALDIFNLIVHNKNIIDMLINDNIIKEISLLFITIYIFIMVLIFPSLRYIIRWFYTYFKIDIDDYADNKDYKYLFIAKKEAIIKENDFLLSRIEKEENKNKEVEKELNIDFSLGLLIFIDYILNENSAVNTIYNFIQTMTGLLYFICAFAGAIFIAVVGFWFWVSLIPYKIEKIYLPDKEVKN